MSDARPLYDRLGGRPVLLRLLKHFYADVRQHRFIGPVFERQIADWPTHIEKIADFWSGATGGPPVYRGAMPARHVPLGLTSEHFAVWLDLWGRNCRAQLPPAEAAAMVALANTIGERLRTIVGADAESSSG